MGLSFEDMEVGSVMECGEHTFTRDEIVEFAERFDPQPFHVDDAAAAASPFGGLIASGWHTCSVLMGLLVRNALAGSTSMGSPGIDEIRWLKPVRVGDTIRMTNSFLDKRVSSSKPDRGIVTTEWAGINQHGETVIIVRSKAVRFASSGSGYMKRDVVGLDAQALRSLVGGEPLVSEWLTVDQTSVNGFAAATGDHQWIHVDPERARRESPFGGPIAHGFLTLSLIPALLGKTVTLKQRMGVNYGLNRVRFTAPVPVGSQLRARFAVASVDDVDDAGVQVVWNVTLERQGSERPVCVAEFITRHYF